MHFGCSGQAECGASERPLSLTTAKDYVTCPKCRRLACLVEVDPRDGTAYQPTPRQTGEVCAICRHRPPAPSKSVCDVCLPPDEGELIAQARLNACRKELEAIKAQWLKECQAKDVLIQRQQCRIENLEKALRYAADCSTLEMVKDTARGMGVVQ